MKRLSCRFFSLRRPADADTSRHRNGPDGFSGFTSRRSLRGTTWRFSGHDHREHAANRRRISGSRYRAGFTRYRRRSRPGYIVFSIFFIYGARPASRARSSACGAAASSSGSLTAFIPVSVASDGARPRLLIFPTRDPRSNCGSLSDLVGGSPGFAVVLRRDYEKDGSRYGARNTVVRGSCQPAIRFVPKRVSASLPYNLPAIPITCSLVPKPVLDGLLLEIKENTVLLRGARLLSRSSSASKELGFAGFGLPRWKW